MIATTPVEHFADLSRARQRALVDIVQRGGIEWVSGGWDGSTIYASSTVSALVARKLCKVNDGFAAATDRGRQMVRARFSSHHDEMIDFLRGAL